MPFKVVRIWPCRAKWVNNVWEWKMPRDFFDAVWEQIPRRYRDNHIVVEVHEENTFGCPSRWYLEFHDCVVWARPVEEGALRDGENATWAKPREFPFT